MQTIQLKFQAPLKNAVLVSGLSHNRFMPANDSKGPEENSKLAETKLEELAKSSQLIKEELAKFGASLERQFKGWNDRYRDTFAQVQELTVQLSMEIATAVVGYEVGHHETRIRQLLETLFSQHEPPIPMVVYVNKIDLDRLRISLLDTPSLDSMLQLKFDDSLAPGDVRVESAEQRLIASCQQQLSNIQRQLMEYLIDARPEPTSP